MIQADYDYPGLFKQPAIFIGANRGGMRECYHGPCDIYDHKNQENNKINWKFLVQTTQTLIGKY